MSLRNYCLKLNELINYKISLLILLGILKIQYNVQLYSEYQLNFWKYETSILVELIHIFLL